MKSSHGTFPLPRGAAFSFAWPPNTFATTLVGTDGQTYEAIHLDSGVRCVKIAEQETPVVLVDVGEGRKVLLSGINPLHGHDWLAFAEALLRESKDAPTIACEAGVIFPRAEFETSHPEEAPSAISEAVQRVRIDMRNEGCSVATVTAMDFSPETMSVPAVPIEFKDVFLFALVDTVGGVETIAMSFLFGPDSWVRA